MNIIFKQNTQGRQISWCQARRTISGFTLVELMVVLVVVGILGALAYPNYTQYVLRTHRVEAQGALMEAVLQMERYYTDEYTYEDANLSVLGVNKNTTQGRYALSLSDLSENTFTITATPQGAQAQDMCGALSVNHLMIKTPSTCW